MSRSPITDKHSAAVKFVEWLSQTVLERSRGDEWDEIDGKPADRFWLGRLAPTTISAQSGRDNRGERLEPCEIGIRLRPAAPGPWRIEVKVDLVVWSRNENGKWLKLRPSTAQIELLVAPGQSPQAFGVDHFTQSLDSLTGAPGLSAEIRTELVQDLGAPELLISLVNTSTRPDGAHTDPRFYEARLEVSGIETQPFLLESLEDTFRYDRRVAAYGINCGVARQGSAFCTVDTPTADKPRPKYWGANSIEPIFSFSELAKDPLVLAGRLAYELEKWGAENWSQQVLEERAGKENWTEEMLQNARDGALAFDRELARVQNGVTLLASSDEIRRAFVLMNRAMRLVGERKGYDAWRPFQLGFLLSNLASLVEGSDESNVVDIVWFATGGGKTETYLGLLVSAAFLDRLRGKHAGVTAWSRFPLRLLSLQQIQRFADAMAAAELVRRQESIIGAPFSVGFLVGDGASPNRVRRPEQQHDSRHDPDDPHMPGRYRMLQQCPFCQSTDITMKFDTGSWMLQHRCTNEECSWPEKGLPFYVVDEEVFRVLPTVIVGTLDKAALIGQQQAMRGLVGPPRGICPKPSHGFTYNPSGRAPTGCLVPDCTAHPGPLQFEGSRIAPSFRLQDELHLLRDSLGAVDGHYEAVLDGLQEDITGILPKVIASSATLSGYKKQAHVLYRRHARVFPQPGPAPHEGFWSKSTDALMRRFVAIAPRGATLEFAIDRLINELQRAVRLLNSDPFGICTNLGIDPSLATFLLSQYGTDVIFGSTLRDLDAVSRSSGTQLVDIEGPVNEISMTGRTQFEDVSTSLDKLQKSDETVPFEERIHLILASSMMSHGVDVDRLNVMIVVGMPLTTAEFIQATARVGRKWPAIVFVVHKMARERDAGVFRSFEKFVEQGDRFVEPIPITGRSRRVLERTLSGLGMARLLHIHAATATERLTTVNHLRAAIRSGSLNLQDEASAIAEYLQYSNVTEETHIGDIFAGLERFFEKVERPTTRATEWYGNVWPSRPMSSLRDVEEQVTIHLRRDL